MTANGQRLRRLHQGPRDATGFPTYLNALGGDYPAAVDRLCEKDGFGTATASSSPPHSRTAPVPNPHPALPSLSQVAAGPRCYPIVNTTLGSSLRPKTLLRDANPKTAHAANFSLHFLFCYFCPDSIPANGPSWLVKTKPSTGSAKRSRTASGATLDMAAEVAGGVVAAEFGYRTQAQAGATDEFQGASLTDLL